MQKKMLVEDFRSELAQVGNLTFFEISPNPADKRHKMYLPQIYNEPKNTAMAHSRPSWSANRNL